jgi:hypothetical protein
MQTIPPNDPVIERVANVPLKERSLANLLNEFQNQPEVLWKLFKESTR